MDSNTSKSNLKNIIMPKPPPNPTEFEDVEQEDVVQEENND